jgi:hypothetical protein
MLTRPASAESAPATAALAGCRRVIDLTYGPARPHENLGHALGIGAGVILVPPGAPDAA